MRTRTCLVMAVLALCAPGRALAQPADVHTTAEDNFRLGREALTRGDVTLALDLFRTSHRLEPGRGKLLNIAVCEEKLGLFASAFKHFQDVRAQLQAGDDREPIVKQHLDAVGPQVPYLKIQLAPGAAAGTTVTLDGEPLPPASLGVDTPIDPGKHVVTATGSSVTEKRYEVTLSAAEHRAIDVALDPPALGSPAWTVGIVALGVGGASLLVGVGTGAAAMAKRASTVKLCPRGPGACPLSEQPDIDVYNRLGAASTATFVIGGALAATGLIVAVASRRGSAPAAGAWIAPVLGPGMLGAQGRF